ncbi:ATP-binding cassette domain-containing protein [Micromonospora sp. C95]|uniref:ATP-binding cassette domain-containing protein n=1 Tax=Micromonospora sp. C95 TaxID=2824882 RepID=UPI001B35CB46|nr:ATP-binding cassette domain-containing protein [Micromonospora sp. C95]MBQ1026065.1 ATP-binding cassette domain-containing protein [Micromonospora sp. C95]
MPEPRPGQVSDRRLVLRLWAGTGTPLRLLSIVILTGRSLVPAAVALAAGALVRELVEASGSQEWATSALGALLPLAVLLIIAQVVEFAVEPLRLALTRRVDGTHRRAVEAAVSETASMPMLEDPGYQDLIARAAGEPTNRTGRTSGSAVWGLLCLWSRLLANVLAVLVIARDSPVAAGLLLLIVLVVRHLQAADALLLATAWTNGVPHRRLAGYWDALLTGAEVAKELRIFGLASWMQARYRSATEAHLNPHRAARRRMLRRQWLRALILAGGTGVVIAILALSAARGQLDLSRLATDLAAVWAVAGGAFAAQEVLDYVEGLPAARALEELRHQSPAATPGGDGAPFPAGGGSLLRLSGIRFGYTGRDVLQGLDLEIPSGKLTALVGLNGAGKTTVTKLVAGLYLPRTGRITLDGVSLVNHPDRHRLVCVAAQDPIRYALSFRDNVRLAAPGHSSTSDLEAAVQDAGLGDLVARLPAGWDTPLSPNRTGGVDISGGQWARVGLARALFAVRAGARIVLFDEPTAHLDVQAETEVIARIQDLARQACVLLISHRLATVRKADTIVILSGGVAAETGSHHELMALGGIYSRLYRLQADRFAAPATVTGPEVPAP